MHGQRVGYIRVSSFDQNPERQLEHVSVDRVFTDKASGKDTRRPELESLLAFVREGDTMVVHSMDRLARNLDDLRRLVIRFLLRRGDTHIEGGAVLRGHFLVDRASENVYLIGRLFLAWRLFRIKHAYPHTAHAIAHRSHDPQV